MNLINNLDRGNKIVLVFKTMIHDITHCKGDECPQKDNCYRYLAYIELVEQKAHLPVSMFLGHKESCINQLYKMKITTDEKPKI